MKRFLIPAGEEVKFIENGFLPNPDDKYQKLMNETIVSFEEIENEACLIILGEPGIGKTTLLKNEAKRLSENNKKFLWVDLKDVSDSTALKEEIVGQSEIKNIAETQEPIYLFLDGVDESIITFDKLSSRIIKEFEKLPREKIFLRISGRTVNFPASLINELQSLWNVKDKCFEICPLRWIDVEDSAKNAGISDTEDFYKTIIKLNLFGFANRPITLPTVIELYKEKNLTQKQSDIYLELCQKLAKENNPYRIEQAKAGHQKYEGDLSSKERLYIAGRIATCLIFSNKISVFDSVNRYNMDISVNIDDLCTGYELIDGKTINITKENIREVLKTSLFSLNKMNLSGFAHKSYAEFLAAWYIDQKNLDIDSLISLITFPESHGEIVPQLYEVASWLSSFNNEIFDKLSESDPEVLITSSVNYYHNKEKLVKTLFELTGERKLSFNYMENVRKLSKLSYEGIEKLIKIYFEPEYNQDNSIKLLAIMIIRFCNLNSLDEEVYKIAKNTGEDYEIRKTAFATLTDIASIELKKQIFSDYDELINDFNLNDPDNSLKGSFLYILWPDYISTKVIFSLLNDSKNSDIHGTYRTFINEKIVENLDNNSVIDALDWIASIKTRIWDIPFVLRELMKNIYEKAFINFSSDESVLNKLANTIYQRYKKDYWHLENFDRKVLNKETVKRQNLIKEIIFNVLVEDDDYKFFARSINNIIQLNDIPWLVNLYKQEQNQETKAKIGKILKHFQKGWIIEENNLELRQIFDNFNSDKEIPVEYKPFNYEFHKKQDEEEEKPNLQLFSYIDQNLEKIEDGNYLNWGNLTANINPHGYVGDITDYKNFPVWQCSEDKTKTRIINAAKQFIEKDKTDYSFLINLSSWPYNDYLGYDALFLVYNEDPDYVFSLDNKMLEQWVTVVFTWVSPLDNLARLFYEKIPDSVIQILSKKINSQSTQDYPNLDILKIFDENWDERLTDLLENKLSDLTKKLNKKKKNETVDFKPEIVNSLFDYLIKHDEIEAKNLLSKLINIYKNKKHIEPFLVKACLSFIDNTNDAGWDIIWPIIKNYNELGKNLVMEIGFYRNINSGNITIKLNVDELTNLFICLEENFPFKSDPQLDNTGRYTKRYEVARLRWQIFNVLVNNGEIKALEKIISENPNNIANEEWFNFNFTLCRKNYYKIYWQPNSLSNIIELINNPEKHIINDAESLFKLILKTLDKIQDKFLAETSRNIRFWNSPTKAKKKIYTPKDENDFSNEIKNCLEDELSVKKIIINREPEIQRGEKTDIKIDLLDGSEKLTIIIESKGCWNPKIKDDIKDQLADRYLNSTSCNYGIYLVGWFYCTKWDESDYRKSVSFSQFKSIEEMLVYFQEKDKELSTNNKIVKTFVFDATLY